MGLEASIKTALAAVAGGRTHPDVPPDNPTFPLNVYQQVGGAVLNPLEGGDPNQDNARVQIVTWAKTRLEAASVARAVRLAMSSALNATLLGAPVSVYDETTKLYGARADYSVWYTP
jgi:hypothetical protein